MVMVFSEEFALPGDNSQATVEIWWQTVRQSHWYKSELAEDNYCYVKLEQPHWFVY